MTDIQKALVGKTIVGYVLSDDRELLSLSTVQGLVKLRVEGDCCSISWIEGIDDPEALLGTVMSVEEIPMPDLGNVGTSHQPDVCVVSYYGLKITTEKGRCVIDYRNDSNGYYGGYIRVAV